MKALYTIQRHNAFYLKSKIVNIEKGDLIQYFLFVELPVRFTKNLEEEMSVIKGQPMYLTCELSKDRDVLWKKDGKPLSEIAGKVAISVIGLQRSVTIQDSNDDDAGVYTCECENLKTQSNVKIIGKYK